MLAIETNRLHMSLLMRNSFKRRQVIWSGPGADMFEHDFSASWSSCREKGVQDRVGRDSYQSRRGEGLTWKGEKTLKQNCQRSAVLEQTEDGLY